MQVQGKILTVDDDSNNITIVEELLDDNYELKTATSGEEALEIAQDFQPDIILLDIMMPGMNGYEVCRRLREYFTSEQTKIIMVSARAMVSERLEGYDAGADDYITKPFDGDEFLAKIKLYMDLKQDKEMNSTNYEIATTVIDELRVLVFAAKNIISDASSNTFGMISKQLRHQLEIANACIDSIESTMNNFHDILEIHRSKMELKQTIFSIQSVVLEVIDILEPKAASRKICLSTDMPFEEMFINADRGKIEKILKNLIYYAIKETFEGNSINIRVKSIEDKICVNIEAIRTEMERSNIDVALSMQGYSLALIVTQKLAELHGGRVWIESKPRDKTVFAFEIPTYLKTETATIEPALSSAGISSQICEQADSIDTESEYTI